MLDCIVINGRVVIPFTGVIDAHVAIADGKIVRIFSDTDLPEAQTVIDARGKYVFPGIVDPHCHFGNFFPFFQDIERESQSAVAGGVTTIVTQLKAGLFSDDLPPYAETFPRALEELRGKVSVDFGFTFNIPTAAHVGEIGQHFREFGVQSYKLHTGYKPRKEVTGIADTSSHLKRLSPGVDDGIIYLTLRETGALGGEQIVSFHCETDEIVEKTTAEARDAGGNGLAVWDAARPAIAEAHSIAKIAYLARMTGATMYVVHLSSGDGLDVVRTERARGTRIIAETCPHYLVLDTSTAGLVAKVNPPIRSHEHVERLWEGIKEGTITIIGSDHSVKMARQKGPDIWSAQAGFTAIETSFPLFFDAASKHGLSPVTIAELCAANAAKTFALYPKKGTIAVGSDADLAIVDPAKEVTIDTGVLHTAADCTPFEGLRVTGWPVLTMLRGRVVCENGTIIRSGEGRYLPRYPGGGAACGAVAAHFAPR